MKNYHHQILKLVVVIHVALHLKVMIKQNIQLKKEKKFKRLKRKLKDKIKDMENKLNILFKLSNKNDIFIEFRYFMVLSIS